MTSTKYSRILPILKSETHYLVTHLLLLLTLIPGSGRLGSMIRVMVLRLLDFKIGQRTAIRAGFAFSGNRKLLKIGENTNINFNSCFDLMDQINIGNYCQIGPNVSFITSSHTLPSDFISRRPDVSLGPLIVEDFVFMGANVTILGGITVGKGSVIAAGSLVNKTVPQNSLVGGVPARVIKEL